MTVAPSVPDSPKHVIDVHGRFNEAGVTYLAGRRGCVLLGVEIPSAVIRRKDDPDAEKEFAFWGEEGWWYPAEIYRACTKARGEKVASWETPNGSKFPPTGMKDDLIAELIASDGVPPYYRGQWSIAMECVMRTILRPGQPIVFGDRKTVKTAIHAVVDAGLAALTLGPRQGWVQATLTWNVRAMTPEGFKARRVEDAALREIAGS
jgi:hypothetical protein